MISDVLKVGFKKKKKRLLPLLVPFSQTVDRDGIQQLVFLSPSWTQICRLFRVSLLAFQRQHATIFLGTLF